MSDTPLTFKEMCERFDVTPRTLRYYEYIELLSPIKEGRARYYGPREIARMTLVLRGRRFGFSLEDIRQFLMLYDTDGTDAQMQTWVNMADAQIEVLEAQRLQLEQVIAELRQLRDESAASLK